MSLTALDLSECESLVSVRSLRTLGSLRKLDLNRSPAIRDLDLLTSCRELRDLRFDSDPPAAAAVLVATAWARQDVAWFQQEGKITELLKLVGLSKAPGLLTSRLAGGFSLGHGAAWAAEALLGLVRVARKRGEVAGTVWQEVFDACLRLGDPAFRPHLQAAVEALDTETDRSCILGPWLETLARVPESARSWALDQVAVIMETLADDSARKTDLTKKEGR